MKFKQVQGNYENLIKLFEAPAIISEDEGYEAFQVNFLLYSREPEVEQRRKFGSCFELLRKLVKNSNSAMPLNKDTLVTILSRNSNLLNDLKDFDFVPEFDPDERELIIAVENSFFRIPTFDFAMVKQEDCIYICTALETGYELESTSRIFLKLTDFPSILEGVLKNFMRKPSKIKMTSSLPILPSIDTSSLVIQPSTIFENFIESEQDPEQPEEKEYEYELENKNENRENHLYNYQENNQRPVKTKVTKSNSISPKKPKKTDHPSSKSSLNTGIRKCLNCFCASTPMWRRGPDGEVSLCNACGVKFKAGKLQMSPELVEMNKRKIQQDSQQEREHHDSQLSQQSQQSQLSEFS